MRQQVTFRCALLMDLEKQPPGEELAKWIADKMTAEGLVTRVIDTHGDFAWWIESESHLRMPGALLGLVDDGPYEWLLQIISSVSWIGRRLGRSDEEGRRLFSDRLHSVLINEPAISDVRWHAGEWGEPGWANSPTAENDAEAGSSSSK